MQSQTVKKHVVPVILGVLSIAVSVVFCWIPVGSQGLSVVLGVSAVIIGLVFLKKFPEEKLLLRTGIILGLLGLIYGGIRFITFGLPVISGADKVVNDEVQRLLQGVWGTSP
jgi:hypothetical protein